MNICPIYYLLLLLKLVLFTDSGSSQATFQPHPLLAGKLSAPLPRLWELFPFFLIQHILNLHHHRVVAPFVSFSPQQLELYALSPIEPPLQESYPSVDFLSSLLHSLVG
jgi:hypothetical protein